MSDFEEYVEEPARLLDPGAFDEHDPHHPHWAMEQRRDIARRRARLVLEQAGPRIAKYTRERMVAAAARAVERECAVDSLAAVRELHSAKQVPRPSHFTTWCDECQCSWPCHTAAILEGMVP